MKIAIIGLGLIGGSIALQSRALGHEVVGFDQKEDHIKQAIEQGLINSIMSMEEAILDADLIGLCVPVDGIKALLPEILDKISFYQTVFDVGSTKENICKLVADHPKRDRFVATHPLAGTEFSGPSAALSDLFIGKKNMICEETLSAFDALKKVKDLFTELGMKNIFMTANNHDKHMAYVSHLSHVTSFTLGLTVLDIEKDEKQIFNLASTGLASTVRLAKSSPETWGSIFTDNATYLSKALEKYIDYITDFKKAVDTKDLETMTEMMQRANEMRRVLKGMKLKN